MFSTHPLAKLRHNFALLAFSVSTTITSTFDIMNMKTFLNRLRQAIDQLKITRLGPAAIAFFSFICKNILFVAFYA